MKRTKYPSTKKKIEAAMVKKIQSLPREQWCILHSMINMEEDPFKEENYTLQEIVNYVNHEYYGNPNEMDSEEVHRNLILLLNQTVEIERPELKMRLQLIQGYYVPNQKKGCMFVHPMVSDFVDQYLESI